MPCPTPEETCHWAGIEAPASASAEVCTGKGIELQVLGSGGPELQTKRASSSYLIWRDGKAAVLVAIGGGAALRFGQSGAQMADLDVLLLSHLHVDHVGDLPALIKSAFFEDRTKAAGLSKQFGAPRHERCQISSSVAESRVTLPDKGFGFCSAPKEDSEKGASRWPQ